MKVYEYKSTFGWDGDNGVGDRLIQQIIDGIKTATCSFKVLYTVKELDELYRTKGKIVTVVDKNEKPKCNIRIIDIFETTFGKPDMRLVRGEGDGDDVEKFQNDHRIAWENSVTDKILTNETRLIVELFELVEVCGGH